MGGHVSNTTFVRDEVDRPHYDAMTVKASVARLAYRFGYSSCLSFYGDDYR